jgi:hypothetical protein
MTDDLIEQLRPCPFCGGEVEIVRSHVRDGSDWIRHKGVECGLEFSSFNLDGDLATAWNTRPAIEARDAEIARLTEALTAIHSEAMRENGRWVHLKRCIAVMANAALTGKEPQ